MFEERVLGMGTDRLERIRSELGGGEYHGNAHAFDLTVRHRRDVSFPAACGLPDK